MIRYSQILFVSLLSLVAILLVSCNTQVKTERISLQPQLLNDEIYTMMPGDLLLTDDYLIWTDPFTNDYFVHVHTLTGEKIGVMGKKGEGPGEFITPGISQFFVGNEVLASDANGITKGYLSVDSLIIGADPLIVNVEAEVFEGMARLDKGIYLKRTENGTPHCFEASVNGEKTTFGAYPIPDAKQHIGGNMTYDPVSKQLLFASFQIPYFALYKKEGNTFKLQCEQMSGKKLYEVVNDEIIFDEKRKGLHEIALSKDYIIALQRDYETDPTDESIVGRDPSKCPQTVFLYDYHANLVRIVDLGIPVMRIASNTKGNVLYALGVNPDYVLVKYQL